MTSLSVLFWNRQNKKEKSTRKRKRYPLQFPEDNSEEGAILQTNKPVQKLWNNQKRTTTHYNVHMNTFILGKLHGSSVDFIMCCVLQRDN